MRDTGKKKYNKNLSITLVFIVMVMTNSLLFDYFLVESSMELGLLNFNFAVAYG